MAAVIGLDNEAVEEVCASLPKCGWPTTTRPGQVVISGSIEAVRAAGELATAAGAKRVVPLAVAGAFHTPLMAGAAEALSRALSEVTFVAGTGAFFSTTEVRAPKAGELAEVHGPAADVPGEVQPEHGSAAAEPASLRSRPWRWAPGNVLSGLLKRIARDLPVASTGDGESLRKALEVYGAEGG